MGPPLQQDARISEGMKKISIRYVIVVDPAAMAQMDLIRMTHGRGTGLTIEIATNGELLVSAGQS